MSSILHLPRYIQDAKEYIPHMLQEEGLDLVCYMKANLMGKIHPPSDHITENKDRIFIPIPGFLSGNGTLKLIGDTLSKYGSVAYAPDFPYMNMGPIAEKLELLYKKITNLILQYPDKKIVLIGHSMGGLIAEEVARMLYTKIGKKVHEIITIGTPHGKPEIVRLVQKFIPSGAYVGDLGHREHTNNLDAIMETTEFFSPQVTMKDGLVDPEKQVPRGSEKLEIIQVGSPHFISGNNRGKASHHTWANHTSITGSKVLAHSFAHNIS